jgi:hypothetical protein
MDHWIAEFIGALLIASIHYSINPAIQQSIAPIPYAYSRRKACLLLRMKSSAL